MENLQKAYTVTLIPGDGIGPEVAEAARRCIDATGVPISWEVHNAGEEVFRATGTPLPEDVLESIRKNKVALKGPIGTPLGTGFRSVNVALRKELDLYACVRPCKYYEGIRTRITNPEKIDFTIIRENTEDIYAGIEFQNGSQKGYEVSRFLNEKSDKGKIPPDAGISIKYISISATEKVMRYALEYAKSHSRSSVTVVTKSNIMKYTDGLFEKTAREYYESHKVEYPGIEYGHILVDNAAMRLVTWPEQFQVIVMPNLYGDIISDESAALVGGLGVTPGANIGDDCAVFEAIHGTWPQAAGQNRANPTAVILSGVMMLRHLRENEAAQRLEDAVASVLKEGIAVTGDLAKDPAKAVGTREMADAIIEKVKRAN